MSVNDVKDVMENYQDVVAKLDSISSAKRTPGIPDKDFEELHRLEFELCMTESRLVRKLERMLATLEKDSTNVFFVNRTRKELQKRGTNAI